MFFVKTFKTPAHHYVLDVNSNTIFQSDAATVALIELLAQGITPRNASRQLRSSFPAAVLTRSLRQLRYWKRKGYLSTSRPAGLRFPLSLPELREQLSTGIRQLILGVTEGCNLRCRYCVFGGTYTNFRLHQARNMTFEVAKKAMDFFFEHSTDETPNLISFYGGEPLYNFPLIRQCIAYYQSRAAGRTVQYNLTTNATLMTAEVRDFLAAHDVLIRVSLDGPQQVHDGNRVFRNELGTYHAVRTNLEALRRDYPDYFRRRVSICAVIGQPYKLGPVGEFFDHDKLFEGIPISVNGVRPVGTSYLEEFPPVFDKEEVGALRERYIRQTAGGESATPFLRALFESRLIELAKRPVDESPEPYLHPNQVCTPCARRLFVAADGSFQPCERFNDTISLGNVNSGFDHNKVLGLIDDYIRISEKDCCECWAVRLCRSCFISANGQGMDRAYKQQQCELERSNVASSLVLYCELLEKNPDCLEHLKSIVFS